MQPAKMNRRCYYQLAFWRGKLTCCFALRILNLFENTASCGEVGNARIGQSDLAGRSG
jgi:hypothetical protein